MTHLCHVAQVRSVLVKCAWEYPPNGIKDWITKAVPTTCCPQKSPIRDHRFGSRLSDGRLHGFELRNGAREVGRGQLGNGSAANVASGVKLIHVFIRYNIARNSFQHHWLQELHIDLEFSRSFSIHGDFATPVWSWLESHPTDAADKKEEAQLAQPFSDHELGSSYLHSHDSP